QTRTAARFGSVEILSRAPNASLANGGTQLLDLTGDGLIDLVQMEDSPHGFYRRTDDAAWDDFYPFRSWPNIDSNDPNMKFVDLTGDGRADILITEDQALVWHESLGEDGFGS